MLYLLCFMFMFRMVNGDFVDTVVAALNKV